MRRERDCRVPLHTGLRQTGYHLAMALDERDFFNSRNETRTDKLSCPRCKRVNDYQMRWVVRMRKDRLPPGADERDKAMFAKLRDYMIRVDDSVTDATHRPHPATVPHRTCDRVDRRGPVDPFRSCGTAVGFVVLFSRTQPSFFRGVMPNRYCPVQ